MNQIDPSSGLPKYTLKELLELAAQQTEQQGRQKFYELRTKWSTYLVRFLIAMVIFQFFLTAGVGFGFVNFLNYKKFLYIVIGENFFQIVGLCYIVVKFLFSEPSAKGK